MPRKSHSKDVSVAANANSLFKSHKNDDKSPGCVQNVNVEVNIQNKEDGIVGCFKSIVGLFRKGG